MKCCYNLARFVATFAANFACKVVTMLAMLLQIYIMLYSGWFRWGFGRGFRVGFEGGWVQKKVCTVRGVWLCLRSESPEYNSIQFINLILLIIRCFILMTMFKFNFMILKSLESITSVQNEPPRRETLAAFFLCKKFGSQIIKNYICSCITAFLLKS